MKKLYAYRGSILALIAVAMLAVPGAPMGGAWLMELPLCACLFLCSVILRVLARRSIGEHTRGYAHDADHLVTVGVYAKIRHPLYVSNTGVGCSLAILHLGLSLYLVPFVIVLACFEVLLSRMEDRYLESRFGDEWRGWAACTPAFFPYLKKGPRASFAGCRSTLESVKSDCSTWFWLLISIAVIVALKFAGHVAG